MTSKWYSARVGQEIQVVRWGQVGTPVLLFPTAGGDAEEVERFLVIRALAPLVTLRPRDGIRMRISARAPHAENVAQG